MARDAIRANNAECGGACRNPGLLRPGCRQPARRLGHASSSGWTIVSAAVMTDVPPMVKWTAAVIAGGGVAGLTQGVTTLLRAKSTLLTGGLGNVVIATAELGGALLVSLLALAAPLVALGLVILFLWLAVHLLRQLFLGARRRTARNGC